MLISENLCILIDDFIHKMQRHIGSYDVGKDYISYMGQDVGCDEEIQNNEDYRRQQKCMVKC